MRCRVFSIELSTIQRPFRQATHRSRCAVLKNDNKENDQTPFRYMHPGMTERIMKTLLSQSCTRASNTPTDSSGPLLPSIPLPLWCSWSLPIVLLSKVRSAISRIMDILPCVASYSFLSLVSSTRLQQQLYADHRCHHQGCSSTRSREAFPPHPFLRGQSRQRMVQR